MRAVLGLAQIPPNAEPTPASAPGKPTDVVVTLNPSGSLTFAWKSENAAASTGAYFAIKRAVGGGAFALIGNTGSKVFTDDTLPFGTDAAVYIIQGFRGTLAGNEGEAVTVRMGVGDGLSVAGGAVGAAQPLAEAA